MLRRIIVNSKHEVFTMKFARFPVILAAVLLAAMTGSSLLLANEGDIEVNVATAESNFPDGIVFRVDAESQGIIDEVRVFIKKADQSGRSSYRSIDVEPGETVSGETLLPSGRRRLLSSRNQDLLTTSKCATRPAGWSGPRE